jgi:hypothetical protein
MTDNDRPNLTPDQIAWVLSQPIPQAKPKMLHVEVAPRTFAAVKAKPARQRGD